MRLVKASSEDSSLLANYFGNITLPGLIDLRFYRQGSFFDLYHLQSDDIVTYYLANDHGNIEAMASLIFRPARIEGKVETVCYATDLRVSPSRGAVLSWSQHFLPILEREKRQRNCRFVFSVVTQNQKLAFNAFLRPRSMKRKLPRYFLFRRFQIVSLHGMWPFRAHPLPSIKITHFQESDRDALINYLAKKARSKPISFAITDDDVATNIDRWNGLNWSSFLLAKDSRSNLLGCAAPWCASQVQKVQVLKYSAQALSLKEGLQLYSIVGKAKKLPSPMGFLNFSYLTHLYSENPDIFYSLLEYAYRSTVGHQFLIYTHFDNYWLTTPPRSFISSTIPAGFYCLLSPEQALPDFLKPTHLYEPPDFEFAYW